MTGRSREEPYPESVLGHLGERCVCGEGLVGGGLKPSLRSLDRCCRKSSVRSKSLKLWWSHLCPWYIKLVLALTTLEGGDVSKS